MTKIRFWELNDGLGFSCEGHAGYAPKGRDIVCAGVSALCAALVRRLEEMSLTGMAHLTRFEAADGELNLEVCTEDGDKMSELLLRATFDTVMAGLNALEEAYPDYVYIS